MGMKPHPYPVERAAQAQVLDVLLDEVLSVLLEDPRQRFQL
jgi:hypothetical protein